MGLPCSPSTLAAASKALIFLGLGSAVVFGALAALEGAISAVSPAVSVSLAFFALVASTFFVWSFFADMFSPFGAGFSCGVVTNATPTRQHIYLAGGSVIKRIVLEFAGFLN